MLSHLPPAPAVHGGQPADTAGAGEATDAPASPLLLAVLSHEIRSPLHGILGYARLLESQAGEHSARTARGLSAIRSCAEHVLRLANEVLELSRFQARPQARREVVDLHGLLDELLDAVRVQQSGPAVALRLVDETGDVLQVTTDGLRLRQVLFNLLGNALKFTVSGEVRLRVRALPRPGGGQLLAFEVQDTGCGIAAQDLARVFAPFTQFGPGAQRAAGAGLGLHISQTLVRQLGAELWVHSRPGQGSTFGFTLSLAGTGTPPAPDVPPPLRILVFCPAAACAGAGFAMRLRALGHEAAAVATATELDGQATAGRPDLIVLVLPDDAGARRPPMALRAQRLGRRLGVPVWRLEATTGDARGRPQRLCAACSDEALIAQLAGGLDCRGERPRGAARDGRA
ncbi:sensor histidine kinase [Ideonella sp.]|uniref:sensor histidine kinase n=1 Tax=Ideonella sp. TaxID=1929293 RepID=UPI0035B29009